MAAKEYLNQAFFLDKKISSLQDELDKLNKSFASLRSPQLLQDVVKSTPQGDNIARTVEKIIDMQNKINAEIDRLIDLKTDIREKINRVADEKQRLVLTKRYIVLKTWEQIAVDLDFSFQHIHNIHHDALKSFSKILNT